jgi:hypothetical protein
MQRTRETARENGYVETVFGRRLWLPDINAGGGPRRAAAERAAINAQMQGTAADLVKHAMIAVRNRIRRDRLATKLLLQVHDELVLEVPEHEVDRVKGVLLDEMSGVAELSVPLVVDVGVGPNWERISRKSRADSTFLNSIGADTLAKSSRPHFRGKKSRSDPFSGRLARGRLCSLAQTLSQRIRVATNQPRPRNRAAIANTVRASCRRASASFDEARIETRLHHRPSSSFRNT